MGLTADSTTLAPDRSTSRYNAKRNFIFWLGVSGASTKKPGKRKNNRNQ